MDETSRLASKRAWVWVIEYVASLPEIDPAYVHGLIDAAPELPGDLGKETREIVALRCIEHLFGSRNDAETNISSAAKSKVTFDISKSCEEVLLSILKETSISDLRPGTDQLKWDMQPFIGHKKSSMSKSSLELLKDALLEGSHPHVSSLIQPSGLMRKDEGNGRTSRDGIQKNATCIIDRAETSKTMVMPQERDPVSLPPENMLCRLGNDSHHWNLLPMKRNGNVLDNKNQADDSKEQGDDHHLSAKRLKHNFSSANETTEKESLVAERESRVERLAQCMSSENGPSSTRMLHKVSVDDSRSNGNCGNQEKSPIDVSSSAFLREISEENSEDIAEDDTSSDGDGHYNHGKVDVAMERSQFLSSRCTLSHVSLSQYTELNLCVKCSKHGQLLVCDAVGCPMVVHEKCLGCSPRFGKKGKFYCPFCAYSYAISKYMETKARAASARKELARFIRKGNGPQKVKVEDTDQTNERHHNKQLKKRKVEKKYIEPVISWKNGNLKRREEEPDVSHETSPVCPGKKESDGIVSENLSVRVLHRDKEMLINENECEDGIQSKDLLEKAVCANDTDEGKATNENAKQDEVSDHSTRLQRMTKECNESDEPLKYQWIKPKRVPWTAEEEEMLKEGVKKFSNMGEKMPWTRILEYGSSVFGRGRSAVDLKDKWRNMEKKS